MKWRMVLTLKRRTTVWKKATACVTVSTVQYLQAVSSYLLTRGTASRKTRRLKCAIIDLSLQETAFK